MNETRKAGSGRGRLARGGRQLSRFVRLLWQEVRDDRLTAESARAAYFFALSIFPIILALFAVTGIFGGDAAFEWIMARLRDALPGESSVYLEEFVDEIAGDSRPGMLSLGVLLTLWSGSNIFMVLSEALNRVYDLEENRRWVLRRALSTVALVVALVFLNTATAALLAGPSLAHAVGLGSSWRLLRWPLAFALLTVMMWLVYYLLPNRDQRGALLPTFVGAVVGSSAWVLATVGFRFYVANFGRFSQTYGFVGGVILLLLWLHLTALCILCGGEVAATLEQMRDEKWEVGSAPGAERSGS